VSNIDIEAERDYFWLNTKSLYAVFKKFSNYDMMSWLEERGVTTQIEDRWRIILASGKATELVAKLHEELIKNNTEIRLNTWVEEIEIQEDTSFKITSWEHSFFAKHVVISSGGKSFASVGTDGWGYRMAQKFWHTLNEPFKGLCGMVSRENLAEVSGSTVFLDIQLFDDETLIYSENDGSFLFTHFGVSGPMMYNAVVKLGEHLRKNWISPEQEAHYMRDHISLKLRFSEHSLTKKLEKFFNLSPEHMEIRLHINDLRSWSEAKVTWGWVKLDELTKNFESKFIPHLYMIGEVIDITGKTWGFNLQSAWSQWYIVGKSFET